MSLSSLNENNQASESENLFPPILDIDNLFPSNERNRGSESIQDSSAGHMLLPPIFIGHDSGIITIVIVWFLCVRSQNSILIC